MGERISSAARSVVSLFGSPSGVSVGLPFGLGSVTYDTTQVDRTVAWKLYVQLVTRKAALPFDDENDTLADVLDSLFELFKIARELLLELRPADYKAGAGVASMIIRVMNDGVRPRLTRWQSDYRRWWENAIASEANQTRQPQEIQRDYSRYEELVTDLKAMNSELARFADDLLAIATTEASVIRRRKRITPAAPPGEP